MVSADGRTSAVMKGIKHGACDYLIKPIREEELKNIWQHVVRKKCNENKEGEHSWSMEDSDRQRRGNDDTEYASSINEGTGVLKGQKKRSNAKEEDEGELDNDDPSSSKKPRVVWSVELHQQFVIAVNQLGLDSTILIHFIIIFPFPFPFLFPLFSFLYHLVLIEMEFHNLPSILCWSNCMDSCCSLSVFVFLFLFRGCTKENS